ncbi:MAG TPA: DUF1990 domain-containing protein [Pyrinomonadaceae bacterium]|nr:DUF1990 domain-containing protein [Pyrinomonadaceae bacterium]
MFTLAEPSEETIRNFISNQSNAPFSYPEVGATQSVVPDSYTMDHNRIELGRGAEVFDKAVEALKQWRQLDLGWVTIVPRGVKLEKGATVAVKARAGGLWSLSAARVVYMVDEEGPVRRFGFAYGTLPDHVERGEERFLIEWNTSDDTVWYDILAFSQPRHPMVRMGFLYARMLQKRFARNSLALMRSIANHP